MMKAFLSNLELGFIENSKADRTKIELLFDFKELKCECKAKGVTEKV